MKIGDKCPKEGCGGEMIPMRGGGWSTEERLVCSNSNCPGKKATPAIGVKLPPRGAGW